MGFQRKLIVVALASVLPLASAYAQSAADLQKEIAALKAQLQALQQKVEAIGAQPAAQPAAAATAAVSPEQVNRLELRADQADDTKEKSGFKDLVIKGTIQALYMTDNLSGINNFRASDGNDVTSAKGGTGMIEFTKHHEGGDAVDWTLRLTPGSGTSSMVNEASVSIPVGEDDSNRVIGGLIGDWTGYEYLWANQNPLVTHNALYDFLSATSYEGIGMNHQLYSGGGQTVALKWLVGNIDSGVDTTKNVNGDVIRSTGIAYRLDWALSEYASLGFAGNVANGARNWQIHEVDGGYIRGDWSFNGMLTYGVFNGAAVADPTTGLPRDASWWGASALAAYKTTPRLQLIARADYIDNHANGGGTYGGGSAYTAYATGATASGLGLSSDGVNGANLTRVSLGTNYQLNPNAQWKLEYRIDKSTGDNFLDSNGVAQSQKNTLATAVVWGF